MTPIETNQAQTATPKPTWAGRWWIIALGATLTLGFAYAVFEGIHSRVEAKTELHQMAIQSAVSSVNVVFPSGGNQSEDIELPGSTQAFTETPIYARTSGYVRHWYADIGARVKHGQLLAVIETPELDQQLQQAMADLKNAEANLQIADITATRWQNLLRSDSVSHQEADQAVSDFHAKEALVESKRANVDRLQQLQAFERIVAPFDGVITARNTDIGALIQADTTAPKELFHISAVQKLRIYVPIPEIYAPTLKTGDKAAVTFDAFPGQPFAGVLVRNANAIDPNSRTLTVEVDIDNSSRQLMPGAYAFVHFKVPPRKGSVTIPSNALLFRSEGLRVGVVRNSRVVLVPIAIGQDYGDAVEVISGLAAHDAVIVNPSDSLTGGAEVRVESNPNGGERK
ncbi:efflux RND transporter periplasmic adaptor subunit [Occallatibacter riparius]|uniref:Efflux RND transporter periplasmic adaptor subunit n=1 Tax=Occallatibacter riparius TaxID=1002689 RepID=A0A9J7BPD9_9BACT|nr:efflux RND transporter periplasmic adaptor subunit [Occallatibacter riparius]UWZ82790.1 efflux RND transporter periplasmic adaptor subunit [Occallatibacter riparius]